MQANRALVDFAQGLETCFRRLIAAASNEPPAGAIGSALYRHLPLTQGLLGRPGPIGHLWLSKDIATSVKENGTVVPSAPKRLDPAITGPGDILDSVRAIGAVEEALELNICAMFKAWLAAEQRRDAGRTALLTFCNDLAARICGFEDAPLPGIGTIPPGHWSPSFNGDQVGDFALAAGMRLHQTNPDLTPDTCLLEGARLCGRIEAVCGGREFASIVRDLADACGAVDGDGDVAFITDFAQAAFDESRGVRSAWFEENPRARPGRIPGCGVSSGVPLPAPAIAEVPLKIAV